MPDVFDSPPAFAPEMLAENPISRAIGNIGSGCKVVDLRRHADFGATYAALAEQFSPEIERFIFLHIPRTGGSVFLRLIEEWYAPGRLLETCSPDETQFYSTLAAFVSRKQDPAPAQCIHLHIPYPIHQVLDGRWPYVTLLRHPIERAISQYRIVAEATAAGWVSFLGQATGSLLEYLETYPERTTNIQTRYILNMETFTTDVAATCAELPSLEPEVAVSRCLAILDQRFAFVGLSDAWSMSVLAFSLHTRRFEAPLMYDFLRSVMPVQPTEQEIALIMEQNRLDIALYEAVKARVTVRYAPIINFLETSGAPALHIRNAGDPFFQNCAVV